MATYTAGTSKHATLTAATVDTVTLSSMADILVVTNRDATAANTIYFTTDGTTPTSAGDNTFVVPAGKEKKIFSPRSDTIKLISATASPYSVEAVQNYEG